MIDLSNGCGSEARVFIDGDGQLEIVAIGMSTENVRYYKREGTK